MYNEIKNLGLELDSTQPATNENIEEFENKLSIKLGEEYKTFLKEFGTLEVEYLEFYGYFKHNKGLPSAINATIYARDTIEDFPKDLVVFYESGNGTFYCLNSKDEVFECIYNRCKKTEETFKSFITNKIKNI